MSNLPLTVAEARAILYVNENSVACKRPGDRGDDQYVAWLSIVESAKRRVIGWDKSVATQDLLRELGMVRDTESQTYGCSEEVMSDDLAHRARGLNLDQFAQVLRTAHCASDGSHPCVGRVTITSDGVELVCAKCSDGREALAPPPSLDEVKVAIAGLGVEWDSLTPSTQITIYQLVKHTDLVRRRGAP